MHFGKNTVAYLIIYILKSINIQFEDLNQPAGLGDIFLTCSSIKSRNYQFGQQLILNNKINNNILSEGYNSIQHIKDNIVINKLNHFITNISIYTFEEKKQYILNVKKLKFICY